MISLQQLIQKKYKSTGFRVLLHLLLWFGYWAITWYFNSISLNIFGNTPMAWMDPLFSVGNLVIFYYPFIYFTSPLIFRRKKYFFGVILFLLQLILYTILSEVQERLVIDLCPACGDIVAQLPASLKQWMGQPLLAGIMSSFLSFGIVYVLVIKLSPVIAIKIALDFARERTAAIELEKENLLLEFNFLKSQLNPHFLFNTLNNIHSLIVQGRGQQASGTVAKLSDFLRHSLYESGEESILLSKETKLLEDYIELEKLRLNKTQVKLEADQGNTVVYLPPLLFIPLVENAFKYTADNLPVDSFIDIKIVLEDNKLQFCIRNNYDPAKRNSTGGIGLQNLKKRLQHYYAGKHHIDVTDSDNIYTIKIIVYI